MSLDPESRIFKIVERVLAVLGSVATIIGAAIAVVTFLPPEWKQGTAIEASQIGIANAIAPDGYSVTNASVSIVRNSGSFILLRDTGVLLKGKKDSTFTFLGSVGGDSGSVSVNGEVETTKIGDHVSIPGTSCFVWAYAATAIGFGDYRWSFQYHCND